MWLSNIFYRPLLSAGEPSLFEELLDYFIGKYFSVETGQYDYITIGSGSLVTLQRIVLGIFGGVIIAAGVAFYDKNMLGSFVRKLIKEDCLSPENAKTLAELEFDRSRSVKTSLRSAHKLGKIVHSVEKDAYLRQVEEAKEAYVEQHGSDNGFFMPEYRMDVNNDHFYIPYEEHYRADIRFENKGSGWRSFLLVVIVSVISAALVCFLLPDVLQLVDNMIGILNGN